MMRALLVPEVVQTSGMDCGPAALKAMAAGFGIPLSYEHLREASQTDVDGSSIGSLEQVASQSGLLVRQRVVPIDWVLLRSAQCLPAIAVTRLADGGTHFVLIWRVVGPWVQVMDPAVGRLWIRRDRMLAALYVHQMPVPRSDWEAWTRSDAFDATLAPRRRGLRADPSMRWQDPAHEDAALRAVAQLQATGAIERNEVRAALAHCAQRPEDIPGRCWSAAALEASPASGDAPTVLLQGAVLLCCQGAGQIGSAGPMSGTTKHPMPDEHRSVRREIWRALRSDSRTSQAMVVAGLVAGAMVGGIDLLTVRYLVDLAWQLTPAQRWVAIGAWLGLLALNVLLITGGLSGVLRIGRRLELRLRMRVLDAIARLPDPYVRTRLVSDMTQRAHHVQQLRTLPDVVASACQHTLVMGVTAACLGWLLPGLASWAWLLAGLAWLAPVIAWPMLKERELRCQETSAALSRWYREVAEGHQALEAHGAQDRVAAAFDDKMHLWSSAQWRYHSAVTLTQEVHTAALLALAAAGGLPHLSGDGQGPLILLTWTLGSLTIVGVSRSWSGVIWQLSSLRITAMRALEPVTAGARHRVDVPAAQSTSVAGVDVRLEGVGLTIAGREVVGELDLAIAAGEHVAVVGDSGAGKSSLMGLLLGWHECRTGQVLFDGEPVSPASMPRWRGCTAWVDPQVHVFDDTLLANLAYGNGVSDGADIERALRDTELLEVLDHMPEGLATRLGDGGFQLSDGQAQALRVARALLRRDVRLVVLDEPARGLGRPQRERLVGALRRRFRHATLVCVSHDVGSTLDFDRVVVMAHGRIVEVGHPGRLAGQTDSHLRRMLDEEAANASAVRRGSDWRRLQIRAGELHEITGANE